jgi:hypothetical protein
MASCRCSGLFGTVPVSCGWRSAPQCCAWQSVHGRCRVRQLSVPLGREVGSIGSRRFRPYRSASPAARNPPDAQPFHREDVKRATPFRRLSCQTLELAMTDELRFEVLEIHMSPWDAHVSRALLESEGIPAFLGNEHVIWINWPMSLMLGSVRLLVPAAVAESARNVLAMRDRGDLHAALVAQQEQITEVCHRCGSAEFTTSRDWVSISLATLLLFFCKAIFPPAKARRCKACKEPVRGEP